MVGRKGFIHVVEAVIIAVVAIAMIPSMLHSVRVREKWTRTNLERTGRDILTSLRKNGKLENIMSYNHTEINNLFKRILGTKSNFIHYSLRTKNAYKNSIRVGFNCTGCNISQEKIRIRDILKPVWLNGRFVNFQLIPFSWKNFTGRVRNYDVNVIFLRNQEQVDLAENYWGTGKIKNHIADGRGIVEYVNLRNNEVRNNDLQEKTFGLTTGAHEGSPLEFKNRNEIQKTNYESSRLFYGVGSTVNVSGGDTKEGKWTLGLQEYKVNVTDENDDGKYSDEDVCISGANPQCNSEGSDFSLSGEEFKVEKIRKMESGTFSGEVLIWFKHLGLYDFTNFVNSPGEDGNIIASQESDVVLQTQNGREAGFVVNEKKGRTAWVSKGNGDDIKGLVQTAVIWSAGRGWWNLLRSPQMGAVKARQFVVNNQEIYEPYEVVLTLWYIY